MSTSDTSSLRILDHRDVFHGLVKGRKVIYLDTNIWVELADGKTEEARRCLAECESAVREGSSIFPVSFASVSEVFDQPPNAHPLRQAQIMDRLSLGVTFRAERQIRALEVGFLASELLGLPFAGVSSQDLYTFVYEYLGDGYLDFPPGWTKEDAEGFVRLVGSSPEIRSLAFLVQHAPCEQMATRHKERLGKYVLELDAAISRANKEFVTKDGSVDKNRIHIHEKATVLANTLIPLANRMIARRFGEAGLRHALERAKSQGEGGPRRVRQLMLKMPMQEMHCRMMATSHWQRSRKSTPQDFYDVEHATVGLCYSDYFVSLDGGLKDLIRQCKHEEVGRAKVLGSVRELRQKVAA